MSKGVPVDIRLSAYRMGDRGNERMVWAVAVATDFLESLPEERHRAKLEARDGKFLVKLNGQGIKIGKPNAKASFMWSSQIGVHHLVGMGPPDDTVKAMPLKGLWYQARNWIEVRDVPDIVKRAMAETTEEPRSEEEQFPGTHFVEDVKTAAFAEATSVTKILNDDVEIVGQHEAHTSNDAEAWLQQQIDKGARKRFSEIVELTPELAAALLSRNESNRKLRSTKLDQYIRDIEEDRWQFNGETITVSNDGKLNNGQHRCHAVLSAGKSIETLLVFGVTRESRSTVDTGATRGAQDFLALEGYTQPNTLSALTRFVITYERNEGKHFGSLNRVTHAEVISRSREEAALDEASVFAYAHHKKSRRLAPPSVLAFCYYLFSKKDKEATKEFMDQVILGIGLAADDPAYVTREKLFETSSLVREQKIEILIRGWNAFRAGRKLKGIRVKWEIPDIK
jgi:hypothetical protein